MSQNTQITLATGVILSVTPGSVTLDITNTHVENVGKYLSVEVPEHLRPPTVVTAAMSCASGYSAGLSVYTDGRVYVRSYGGARASAWGQVSWVPAASLGNR